jgi:hypothetical protein
LKKVPKFTKIARNVLKKVPKIEQKLPGIFLKKNKN